MSRWVKPSAECADSRHGECIDHIEVAPGVWAHCPCRCHEMIAS